MLRVALFAGLVLCGLAPRVHAQPAPDVPAPKELPDGAIVRLGRDRFNHNSPVTTLAISPDSNFIATGTQSGQVHVWDAATGIERAHWLHGNAPIHRLSFAPDGHHLATSCQRGLLLVWDSAGKQLYSHPSERQQPVDFAWLRDGERLAVVDNRSVSIHDIAANKIERSWEHRLGAVIAALACSPDGKHLALADSAGRAHRFDLNSGKEDLIYEAIAGQWMRRLQQVFQFTPDGKTLVSDLQGQLVLWDAVSGKVRQRLNRESSYAAATLAPSGRFLATGSYDNHIHVLGLRSGLQVRTIDVGGFPNFWMAFAPNGRWLAMAPDRASVRVVDLVNNRQLHADEGHGGAVVGAAFLADGRLVTAGLDRTVRCWDVRRGNEIDYQPCAVQVGPLVPTPDGAGVLLASFRNVLRWQPGSDVMCAMSLPLQGSPPIIGRDGRTVATYDRRQFAVYSSTTAREIGRVEAPGASPRSLAVAPGEPIVAYVDDANYGTIHIHDLARDRERRRIVGDADRNLQSETVLFSPDGRLLATALGTRPTVVWEVATGLVRARPATVGAGASAFAFSPDGHYLAQADIAGNLFIHDLGTGQTAGPFHGHRGTVYQVAFSRDGSQVATAGVDRTAVVWDMARVRPRRPADSAARLTAAQLDRWWGALGSAEGAAASAAIWALAAAPQDALELFRERLKAVPGPSKAELEQWVRDLDDPKFAVREKAQRNLAAAGDSAHAALSEGLRNAQTAEARTRLNRLLAVIELQMSPERLRPLRAIEVLERIGSPGARTQLEALGRESNGEQVRQEIERTLGRWK